MRSPQRDTTSAPRTPAVAAEPVSRDHRPARPRDALLRLQRQHGNRRTRGIIQAKLNVGPADDRFEREADRIAGLAMGSTVQRAPESVQHVHGAEGGVADPAVADAVTRAHGGGHAVPGGVRERMEQVSGADFGGVRVHVDAESDRLNDALGSRAFTVGGDVFVRRSEYRPGTARGDALLGHELTHTIQQGAAQSSAASAPAVAAPTVQRLFGFELELDVPVFSRVNGVDRPPARVAKEIATADDRSFDVHVDHSVLASEALPDRVLVGRNRVASIVELVTRPMNEFDVTEAHVRRVMSGLVNVANHIRTEALGRDRSIPLDELPGLTANPANVNRVGYDYESGTPAAVAVDAYVQQTYGLSLRRVGDEFEFRATEPEDKEPLHAWTEFDASYETSRGELARARESAEALVVAVRKWIPRWERYWNRRTEESGYGDWFGGDAELDEARGLFALIFYYLHIGENVGHAADLQGLEEDESAALMNSAIVKNRLGIFFYKTALSTVRNNLVASHPGLRRLFRHFRGKLVEEIFKLSGRDDFREPVVSLTTAAGGVTCQDWVTSVLGGTKDQIFSTFANQVRNPRTGRSGPQELQPGIVGGGAAQGRGIVLENRRFAESEGYTYTHKYSPNEWPDMGAKLFRYLHDRHGA